MIYISWQKFQQEFKILPLLITVKSNHNYNSVYLRGQWNKWFYWLKKSAQGPDILASHILLCHILYIRSCSLTWQITPFRNYLHCSIMSVLPPWHLWKQGIIELGSWKKSEVPQNTPPCLPGEKADGEAEWHPQDQGS